MNTLSYLIIIIILTCAFIPLINFPITFKSNKIVDKVYCISLKSKPERWDHFQRHFNASDLASYPFKKFEAIDTLENRYKKYKHLITDNAYKNMEQSLERGYRDNHEYLSPGAIGCYMSHYSVIKEAYEKGHQTVLIFEDDAKIPPNFVDQFKSTLQPTLPKDWDMLFFYWINRRKKMNPKIENSPWHRLHRFWCLVAYIINRKGMKKILDNAFPIKYQIDTLLVNKSDEIKMYGCRPNLVKGNNFKSTMQIKCKNCKSSR